MRRIRCGDITFPAFPNDESSVEWSNMKERLEILLHQREKDKIDAIADLIQIQSEEMQEEIEDQNELIAEVNDAMRRISEEGKKEALFYELYAFSTGSLSLKRAREAAAVVAYKKRKQKGYLGNVSKRKKVGNVVYDSNKAILACEECMLMEWNATVYVKRFYYQNDGCFKLAFWYSLMDVEGAADTPRRVAITPIGNDKLLKVLREAKKEESFIRDHKQIYAELLFDQ